MNMLNKEDARPKDKLATNIFRVIGYYILALIPSFGLFMVMGLALTENSDNNTTVLMGMIVGLLISLVIAYYVIRFVKRKYEEYSYNDTNQKMTKKDIWINVGWAFLIRVVVALFAFAMLKIYGDYQTQNDKELMKAIGIEQMDDLQFNATLVVGIIAFVIAVVVVAPIVEEYVFRGIFKELLFKRSAYWFPMLLTSFIFGISHGGDTILGVLNYVVMGMVMYLAYDRRGNVKDSIMVHMLNNGIATAFIIIPFVYLLIF